MKYYLLYNYKSALEAIVSNFSHSLMITPRPLLRVIISVLECYQSNLYPIFHREVKNLYFIISTSMLLAMVDSIDSTEYHLIINLKRSTN